MRPSLRPLVVSPFAHSRAAQFAYTSIRQRSTAAAATESLSPRWLADVKQRLGKCMTFGMEPEQVVRASAVLETVARDWRELVAGSEGFLTGEDRRGFYRHAVVWGEMDSMSARVNWTRNFAVDIDPKHRKEWTELMTPKSLGLILRSITTNYKFPMKWPDHISVYHKLASEPTAETDSFILDVVIMSELQQRPAARCVEDIVVYDYQAGKKAPLLPFMVDAFRKTWKLQEEAKRVNSEKVRGLLKEVRALEQETWDREDAVEDMGVAGQ
ncbi:hypothetical protein D6D24_07664 [Aureobasidium pullulans]|uniref:Thioesterase/thiol ester dehydrase-isomerase n=1 Tax=Aureobasidium pullulans TaxID=5580 RepID=A0A4S8VK28_AURPU|nr:hypothetical protein D6D26_05395 [Aureobasidium pullulans]THW10790.1 hypothetical protein D6D24_07664 [Aureobasidium pullulans]